MMRRWTWLAVPLLLLLAACPSDSSVDSEGCRVDADCGSPAEACNPAGFCQDRAGCESNADCADDSLFCDTSTGTCLTRGRCGSDVHCPLGEVCDVSRTTCVTGCRSSGDCPGTACRCQDAPCLCDATTPEGRAACALGVCDAGFCADASDCAFGERCGAATCFSDFDPVRRPYCASCTYGGGLQVCGRGANFCLRETASPGTAFCGADCSEGQGCPHGYQCADVVVVASRARCRSDAECAPSPALPCREDSHCGRGGQCVKTQGQEVGACAGRCSIAEGDVEGFCTCQQDTDCVQDACSQGTCTVSRRACGSDVDCRPIRCVDHQGAGGCLVGRNCAPEEGLTCAEVAPR
ncbi:hypothetical protein ACJ2CR_31530 [Myxococcus faecalis]|uniref:hypothetical protein n=1 Tax=Myxococcus faecalis TaxID=3115646 RepID=UPI0024CA9198|nr:hypothetical protein MFMH1_77250 [Myxococcus sp. MH1]